MQPAYTMNYIKMKAHKFKISARSKIVNVAVVFCREQNFQVFVQAL